MSTGSGCLARAEAAARRRVAAGRDDLDLHPRGVTLRTPEELEHLGRGEGRDESEDDEHHEELEHGEARTAVTGAAALAYLKSKEEQSAPIEIETEPEE